MKHHIDHHKEIPQWKLDQIEKSRQELVKRLVNEQNVKVNDILKKLNK